MFESNLRKQIGIDPLISRMHMRTIQMQCIQVLLLPLVPITNNLWYLWFCSSCSLHPFPLPRIIYLGYTHTKQVTGCFKQKLIDKQAGFLLPVSIY